MNFSRSALLLRKSPAKPVRIYLCGAMFKLLLKLELLAIPLVMSYGVTRQRRVQPTEDEPVRACRAFRLLQQKFIFAEYEYH